MSTMWTLKLVGPNEETNTTKIHCSLGCYIHEISFLMLIYASQHVQIPCVII